MKHRKKKKSTTYKELYVELEIIGRGNSGKV